VLITGETGLEKELVARQIHDLSARQEETMIQVNFAAVPEVERHDGNWAAAAREPGLHRSNLHQLAVRLGLRAGQAGGKRRL
jgi:transcriptional regulator with GAF, ATPase, and Fis domain